MKKPLIFLKLYWLRIVIWIALLAAAVGAFFFVNYCIQSYFTIEPFSRRQIAGQMALLLPMFLLVQLIAAPLMIGLQFYFMQGGFAKMFQSKMTLATANVKWDEVVGMKKQKKMRQNWSNF